MKQYGSDLWTLMIEALMWPVSLVLAVLMVFGMLIDVILYIIFGSKKFAVLGAIVSKIDNWFFRHSIEEAENYEKQEEQQ